MTIKKIGSLALLVPLTLFNVSCSKQATPTEAFMEGIDKYYVDKNKCYLQLPSEVLSEQQTATLRGKNIPTISFLVSYRIGNEITPEQLQTKISNAVNRGCDINEVFDGVRVLEQVFFETDKNTFAMLIENGANPLEKMQHNNQKISGKNLFEIAQLFKQQNKNQELADMSEFVLSYQDKFNDKPDEGK